VYNAVLHFLAARSLWDWVEIVGVLLVLVGVAGEIWIPRRKFPALESKVIEADAEDSPILSEYKAKKTAWEAWNEKWEHRAQNAVVIGLALELSAMPKQFQESGELHEQVAKANERASSNELSAAEFRKKAAEFELEIGRLKNPRNVSQEQHTKIFEIMRGTTNGAVRIVCIGDNQEAARFAAEITFALKNSLAAFESFTFGGTFLGAVPATGVQVAARDTNSPPEHTQRLLQAMREVDANAAMMAMKTLGTNMVQIRVYPKR
jgi:hypothetical protein